MKESFLGRDRRGQVASPRPDRGHHVSRMGRFPPMARVVVRTPTIDDQDEFIARMRASRALHRPWISMPETPEEYEAYLARTEDPRAAMFIGCRTEDGAIVGFLNISEIVRGPFKSAFLGYGGVAEFAGQGYMTEALQLAAARGVHEDRAASARGQHPARQQGVDRARRALRVRARGLLAALPEGGRPLARPRAVGDPRRDVARAQMRAFRVPGSEWSRSSSTACSSPDTARACSSSRAPGPASSSCTAGATRPTRGGRCSPSWRSPAARRSRSTCPASARRRGSRRARSSRSSTTSPPRSVLEWGGGEPVVVAGNSLGGAVALRLGERADLPLAGVVPVAPAGLEMPGWFDLVERDPIIRRLLDIPMPVPGRADPRARRQRLQAARVLEPARGAAPGGRGVREPSRLARQRRRAARVRPPPAARAGRRAVRPRRHRVPGAARLGHARPHGPAQRRARRARRAAGDPRRADRGLRPLPAARGHRRAARAPARLSPRKLSSACSPRSQQPPRRRARRHRRPAPDAGRR